MKRLLFVGIIVISLIIFDLSRMKVNQNLKTDNSSIQEMNVNTTSKIVNTTEKEKIFLNANELEMLYTDADMFKGMYVKLTGKIFADIEQDEDGIYFQMWQDPKNNKKNTIVAYADKSKGIKTDDFVRIEGRVIGTFKGTNLYGAEIKAPQILATNVEISSYKDIIAPTIKEVTLGEKTQVQYGYEVSVEKVEFAEEETRVYIKIINNGSSKFNLYSHSAIVVQDGKQFEPDTMNYQANYPKIQSSLLQGSTTEGIILFPRLTVADFRLVLAAYSDESIEDFQFDIIVN